MVAKKKAKKKAKKPNKANKKPTAGGGAYQPVDNDNLSAAFDKIGLIPKRLVGSDKFIDIVTWNLRWFHEGDAARVDRISAVLAALNADVFVFQEIKNESLEPVVQKLAELEAGHYSVAYGTTGGQQRVAFLWDLDWIRAKDDDKELFGRNTIIAEDGKDAFPRLPLWGYFIGLTQDPNSVPFDFQLVGLHLKSQLGGGDAQRAAAADALAAWIRSAAPRVDGDTIVLGDFNRVPGAAEWEAFRRLEAEKLIEFESINDSSEISHLYYENKTHIGSRLDLVLMSSSAHLFTKADPEVVRWASLDQLLSTSPDAKTIKAYIKEIGTTISDHMPTVTRFYFTKPKKKPG